MEPVSPQARVHYRIPKRKRSKAAAAKQSAAQPPSAGLQQRHRAAFNSSALGDGQPPELEETRHRAGDVRRNITRSTESKQEKRLKAQAAKHSRLLSEAAEGAGLVPGAASDEPTGLDGMRLSSAAVERADSGFTSALRPGRLDPIAATNAASCMDPPSVAAPLTEPVPGPTSGLTPGEAIVVRAVLQASCAHGEAASLAAASEAARAMAPCATAARSADTVTSTDADGHERAAAIPTAAMPAVEREGAAPAASESARLGATAHPEPSGVACRQPGGSGGGAQQSAPDTARAPAPAGAASGGKSEEASDAGEPLEVLLEPAPVSEHAASPSGGSEGSASMAPETALGADQLDGGAELLFSPAAAAQAAVEASGSDLRHDGGAASRFRSRSPGRERGRTIDEYIHDRQSFGGAGDLGGLFSVAAEAVQEFRRALDGVLGDEVAHRAPLELLADPVQLRQSEWAGSVAGSWPVQAPAAQQEPPPAEDPFGGLFSAEPEAAAPKANRTGGSVPASVERLSAPVPAPAGKRAAAAKLKTKAAGAAPAEAAAAGDELFGAAAQPFEGKDAAEKQEQAALCAKLEAELPDEWRPHLLGATDDAASQALPPAMRLQLLRKVLKRLSAGVLRNALRAIRHHVAFCAAHEVPLYPVPADIVAWSIESYGEQAMAAAELRDAKREARGQAPYGQGGRTATGPIRLGYLTCQLKFKLSGIDADNELVKLIAELDGLMPERPRGMTPLHALAAYCEISQDTDLSRFERAYAGAAYLGIVSSTRCIDQQRTPKPSIYFERHSFDGVECDMVGGVTRKSKASSAKRMRPLSWYAPLVPFGEFEIDLEPLMDAMPDCADGCMYVDFEVAPGKPKDVTHATAWKQSAADHQTIVSSARAMLGRFLHADVAARAGGHDQRHTVPEVARVLGLPRHVREAMGYWRHKATIADDPGDARALARVAHAARTCDKRVGSNAYCSDRYSSVDGQHVEQQLNRVRVLRIAAQAWKEAGDWDMSEDVRAQLLACEQVAEAAQQAIGGPAGA